MNRYFEGLFNSFGDKEHGLMGNMIYRIGNKRYSLVPWIKSLSEEEKAFVHSISQKVDAEYFYKSIEDGSMDETGVFTETMLYYTTYHEEVSWAVPDVGLIYAEAIHNAANCPI